MATSAMDRALAKIDADIERLTAMREYLLAGAGDETAREPKPRKPRKKKGLPPTATHDE